MPCDTISLAQIELGNVDRKLLEAAMTDMGYAPSQWRLDNGVLSIQGERASDQLTAKIKQHYSKQVVLTTAKKYGWLVKETKPFEFEVLKR